MFFKLRNIFPLWFVSTLLILSFLILKKIIIMLACLHECRRKKVLALSGPIFPFSKALLHTGCHFCRYHHHTREEGILILISGIILCITLVLNPFQIVTPVLHTKVKGASSRLTIKKAGQRHQAEKHGQAKHLFLLNPDYPTELPAKLFLLPAWNDFYIGHFKVKRYSYLQLDYFEIKL